MKYNVKISPYEIIKILTLFLFLSCDNSTAQQKKNEKVNNNKQLIKAPEFTLADLEGNLVTLSDLKGKVIMINFWGTWCGPCRKEIPDFIKLIDKHQSEGLEILGVTLSSGPPKNIQSFADQWNINYTLLTDINNNETQIVTSLYGQVTGQPITGIPTTFIIDKEGFIRKKYVGPRSEKVFFKDIKPLL